MQDGWSWTPSELSHALAPFISRTRILILDDREAKVEFGEAIASKLKLSADGRTVLWPQPSDDTDDPQNVSNPQLLFVPSSDTLA